MAMVIEAGVIAGYVIAWAVRKARRAAGRLDAEADAAIDTSFDRLHEAVTTRLAGHPALIELDEEAAADGWEVSDLTRQQVELAIAAAARRDDAFGQLVTDLVAGMVAAERSASQVAAGSGPVVTGSGSAVFTGTAQAHARDGGIAIGQVGGDVTVNRERDQGNPPLPGRSGR